MAFITFDEDEYIDYIPVDFREDDSDDPFVVQIKPMTHKKVNEYAKKLKFRLKNNKNELKVFQEVQKEQFIKQVGKISGFYYKSLDNPITDAEEFFEKADSKIITEILEAMEDFSKLSQGQKKT